MHALTETGAIHSYDVATRRVRCGVAHPDRSTKHAAGVTCATCRELLAGAARDPSRPGEAGDATLGG